MSVNDAINNIDIRSCLTKIYSEFLHPSLMCYLFNFNQLKVSIENKSCYKAIKGVLNKSIYPIEYKL